MRRDVAVRQAAACLAAAGLPDAALDARLLLCAAAALTHADLVRDPDGALDDAATNRFDSFVARRLAHEPVSRILGRRGFWTLDLAVAPEVLDPRPDTEALVVAALAALGARRHEPLNILDLGTGSGAILCALLAECPRATGVGLDRSAAACKLAHRNLTVHGVSDRAVIRHADWGDGVNGRFDLVVSNPPYIASAAIAALDADVRAYDPWDALDGGPDGLDAYRCLSRLLPDALTPDGVVVLELGAGQRDAVTSIMGQAGMAVSSVQRDVAGIDRALVLRPCGEKSAVPAFPGRPLGRASETD